MYLPVPLILLSRYGRPIWDGDGNDFPSLGGILRIAALLKLKLAWVNRVGNGDDLLAQLG
jgi:hypothetical protein